MPAIELHPRTTRQANVFCIGGDDQSTRLDWNDRPFAVRLSVHRDGCTNIDDARGAHPPKAIYDIPETSVIGLQYRTAIEARWR